MILAPSINSRGYNSIISWGIKLGSSHAGTCASPIEVTISWACSTPKRSENLKRTFKEGVRIRRETKAHTHTYIHTHHHHTTRHDTHPHTHTHLVSLRAHGTVDILRLGVDHHERQGHSLQRGRVAGRRGGVEVGRRRHRGLVGVVLIAGNQVLVGHLRNKSEDFRRCRVERWRVAR